MRPTVHLVASRGGHLELLRRLADALPDVDRVWVTEESARAASLVEEGETVRHLRHYGRDPLRCTQNVRDALAIIRRDRPRVVVCSGAGLTVPFTLLARAAGARVIFIETMARVYNASKSGRVISTVADAVLVQWPDMLEVYGNGVLCRPALLEGIRPQLARGGEGTFVAVGTHHQPFDRLLRLVEDAVAAGVLPGPVVAQTGVCGYRPRNVIAQPYLTPAELDAAVDRAAVVICHAGAGIVSTAIRAGKRPMVLPRRRRHGEHVDDHQLQITRKLSEAGIVVGLDGRIDDAVIERATAPAWAPDALLAAPSLREVLAAEVARAAERGR